MLKIKSGNTNKRFKQEQKKFKHIVGNLYWYKGKYEFGLWNGHSIGDYMYFKFLYRIYLKHKMYEQRRKY